LTSAEQILLNEYPSNESEEEEENTISEQSDSAPELITSREDFESMMDDFLDNYEILGRKMKHKLAGDTGIEKLNTLRMAMGQDDRVRVGSDDEEEEEEDIMAPLEDDKTDRWDCETVLSESVLTVRDIFNDLYVAATYSNTENHPRLIRARDTSLISKIRLDPRTGIPVAANQSTRNRKLVEAIDDDNLCAFYP
jgi:protein LTV1